MLTVNLTAVAGSCGPGSLHFINGLVDANRNRAPVILIATQVASEEIGFNFPQEVVPCSITRIALEEHF